MRKPSNPKDSVGIEKVPASVIPRNVLAEVGLGLAEGARKYGRHNWRAVGVRYSVYFDAANRHLDAFWEGEDIDPDSGLSHVTKAITGLIVLRDAMMQDMATDDRPPRAKPYMKSLNDGMKEIINKYPEAKEAHVHTTSTED